MLISKKQILIETAKCRMVERVPIWLMRQAGRYLPEYRKLREKYSFTEMYKTPELACEVSLQPYKRFGFDGVIYFSDILVIPEAMGLKLNFDNGEPTFINQVTTEKEMDKLESIDPGESLGYIVKLIKLLKRELPVNIPLIGFAGAPFTIACYMIERKSKNLAWNLVKKMMYESPALFHNLIAKISDATIKYMVAQIKAGVNIIQIFDTWAGAFSKIEYELFIRPYMTRIFKEIKKDHDVPLIYYINNSLHLLDTLSEIEFDVLSVDSRCPLSLLRKIREGNLCIQGNLDPAILLTNSEIIEQNVPKILKEGMKFPGYIFNLGHGILPETPIENVTCLVETVKKHGIY